MSISQKLLLALDGGSKKGLASQPEEKLTEISLLHP